MVICNDIDIIKDDERRLGLSNAIVLMEHDNNTTEESTAIALNI